MDQVNANIRCSVNNCAYHACSQDYCTLREIKVGCSTAQPTSCDCTQCASFQLGKDQK